MTSYIYAKNKRDAEDKARRANKVKSNEYKYVISSIKMVGKPSVYKGDKKYSVRKVKKT